MGSPICHNWPLLYLQADDSGYRLIIQRPHATAVFSGDFNHGKSRADPLTALQRTFVGSIVPLEVFAVNNSTLSPQKLCQSLQKNNPGGLKLSQKGLSVCSRRGPAISCILECCPLSFRLQRASLSMCFNLAYAFRMLQSRSTVVLPGCKHACYPKTSQCNLLQHIKEKHGGSIVCRHVSGSLAKWCMSFGCAPLACETSSAENDMQRSQCASRITR